MFSLGYQELILIGVVALVVMGPQRLPEFFRQIGKISAGLRNMYDEFRTEIEAAEIRDEIKKKTHVLSETNFAPASAPEFTRAKTEL